MRVACTIADLEGSKRVMVTHLAEAIRHRLLSEADHSSSIVGRE
jgi:predicted ATPase with chaperone activity